MKTQGSWDIPGISLSEIHTALEKMKKNSAPGKRHNHRGDKDSTISQNPKAF